jgi:transcriptional regulator with XRE-family HTH domain
VDDSHRWPKLLTDRLGATIAAVRKAQKMPASRLSDACAQLGITVHRVAIPRIEQGEQVPTVLEVMAIATALDADWSAWLIKAAEGLPVGGERGQRADLRVVLADINSQLDSVRRSLFQAEQGLRHLNMPDGLRVKLGEDVERYRSMIKNLEEHRYSIIGMLRELGEPIEDA